MSTRDWSKVMLTCLRRGKAVVLLPDTPGYVRWEDSLRSFDIPPCEADELTSDLQQILPPHLPAAFDGGVQFDRAYGGDHLFRFTVLGATVAPSCILLNPLPPDAPPPSRPNASLPPATNDISVDLALAACQTAGARDVVFCPGCPPLLWSDTGAWPLRARTLHLPDLDRLLTPHLPPPEHCKEVNGHLDFYTRAPDNTLFRTAVFAHPSPRFAILMR